MKYLELKVIKICDELKLETIKIQMGQIKMRVETNEKFEENPRGIILMLESFKVIRKYQMFFLK